MNHIDRISSRNGSDGRDRRAVIITRPAAQAEDFARRLQAMGRDCVLFPLLEIQPLPDESHLIAEIAHLQEYALLAFVSPNAIDAFFRHVSQYPKEIPIAVMGEGSRQRLAEYGLNDQTATIIRPRNQLKTDSETLLDELDCAALQDKKVLIVRGESGRELLADALRARGIEVRQLAAYRRVAPQLDAGRTQQLRLLLEQENQWVVTSSEALRNLLHDVDALGLPDGVAKMQRQVLLVPHSRIEETAKSLGFQFITLTASGDEQLLVALQSRL
ncbi:uroporphyrinogen-III synthase [Undibacterium sp. Di26W]|uniref:uroporphyrinogen-III synthase n=1 Tax=Undibacterium sp. Di26W TaxID=3413035 RepID=UPI003BEF67A0